MITNQKTQPLCFSEDINDLLCQIDVKIAEMSKQKLDSKRFGFCYDLDENRFFILVNYRKLLKDKADNKCCLKNYLIDDIINIVKQYLSSGKVLKLQQNSTIPSKSSNTADTIENGINMTIIYKNYGNHIVNNSTFNRYVTEVSGDNWSQTDW